MGSPATQGEITRLLQAASGGDRDAFNRLIPLVYDELRRVARNRLRAEPGGHTLTPTALVHEAYLQIAGQDRVRWQSRSHFFAVAAQAMRRILTNYARMKKRQKRGAGVVPLELSEAEDLPADALPFTDTQADEILALEEALVRLREFNAPGAEVIEYHFFGGLNFREIADVSGVSEVTVRRRWTAARAWLRGELARAGDLLNRGPAR